MSENEIKNGIDITKPVHIDDVRRKLGEAVNLVEYGKRTVVIARRGRRAAAIVPIEDLDLLLALKETMRGRGEETPAKPELVVTSVAAS